MVIALNSIMKMVSLMAKPQSKVPMAIKKLVFMSKESNMDQLPIFGKPDIGNGLGYLIGNSLLFTMI